MESVYWCMTWTAQCCNAAPILQEHLVHFSVQRIAFPSVHRGETTRHAVPRGRTPVNLQSLIFLRFESGSEQMAKHILGKYCKGFLPPLTFHSEVPFPVCKHGGRKCAAKSCICGDILCINISTFKPRLVYKPLKNLSLEHGTSIYLH